MKTSIKVIIIILTLLMGLQFKVSMDYKQAYKDLIFNTQVTDNTLALEGNNLIDTDTLERNAKVVYSYFEEDILNGNLKPLKIKERKDNTNNAIYKINVNGNDKILLIQGIDSERYPLIFDIESVRTSPQKVVYEKIENILFWF